jgi:DNA-binding CsgD family transcriptional regulator
VTADGTSHPARPAARAGTWPSTRTPPCRSGGPSKDARPGEPLTRSETRVLHYLPSHMGTPEIAAELFLSANTVKTHLRHLYRKLGAHNRREAVQRARSIGLLTAPLPRARERRSPDHT